MVESEPGVYSSGNRSNVSTRIDRVGNDQPNNGWVEHRARIMLAQHACQTIPLTIPILRREMDYGHQGKSRRRSKG